MGVRGDVAGFWGVCVFYLWVDWGGVWFVA